MLDFFKMVDIDFGTMRGVSQGLILKIKKIYVNAYTKSQILNSWINDETRTKYNL